MTKNLYYAGELFSDSAEYRWNEIRNVLLEHPKVEVIFTKVDGTDRTMQCTLNENVLPPAPLKEEVTPKKELNHNVINVWDIEKNGWRSFRTDSVKTVKIIDETVQTAP